jgi:hypothetical protein
VTLLHPLRERIRAEPFRLQNLEAVELESSTRVKCFVRDFHTELVAAGYLNQPTRHDFQAGFFPDLPNDGLRKFLTFDCVSVQRWENGKNDHQPWQRPKIAKVLSITAAELDALLVPHAYAPPQSRNGWLATASPNSDDEFDALELARRVSASDVGKETLSRLEHAFDKLAMKYPVSPPQDLLERVRKHSSYVAHLMDARMTLAEQHRLYVVGGWFQLLGATLHIDLHRTTQRQPGCRQRPPLRSTRSTERSRRGVTRLTLGECSRKATTPTL